MRLGTRQVALESVWEVTLLEIFFTFDLVWVPGFGMAPQTTFYLFFSCFSKCEAMEQYTSLQKKLSFLHQEMYIKCT